ncbi:MAG: glycosyltransferase family 4 protein [Bacteroidales bacterium]|nr:glycosyltransferase family 4 protein [Candidatus Physcousia equi]
MMKILWLSNFSFRESDLCDTGTWVQPLAEALNQRDSVEIANVSWGEESCRVVRGIKQWLVPRKGLTKHGHEAPNELCEKIRSIIDEYSPDLVHIWGTESAWASVYRKGYIACPTLLEIQGLVGPCARYYMGGMSFGDLCRCIHLKEILMPWRTMWVKQNVFRKRGEEEKHNIEAFRHIAVQSNWVEAHIEQMAARACIHHSRILLRRAFYAASKERYEIGEHPVLFFSFSGAIPYKGLHKLLEMLCLVKEHFPTVELRIAGVFYIGNRLMDGYSLYLKHLIGKYDLQNQVTLLGPLDAPSLVKELQHADVCVVPSFVETYCLAFAEAMVVGCPVVSSNAAALPELADANSEALFYSPNDTVMGAHHILTLLRDRVKAMAMAQQARSRRLKENDPELVVNNQIEIYQALLAQESACQ